MALREYERRILAEIEQRLGEDDPALAGHLATFGADDPSFARGARGGWQAWAVCGAIAVVAAGLLALLFFAAPGAPDPEPASPRQVPEEVAPVTAG
ncbi:DUF3040 domain-containing protein [Nocardiopsis sediminis]|uniref:DUF3040 domain-containing protein n=1 Tax=Nocardiopsis sediminis TaxID=1778267 RepID=A0ABV8FPP0_9ACTN